MSCCNQQLYDTTFDAKLAQTELEDYLRSGLKKSSRPFLEAINSLPLDGKSLLDIGGGIGAVTFELFGKGISEVTHVDISKAYVDVFQAEAERRSLMDKVKSHHGNFPELESRIAEADLVTLDKVICCYNDYEELVGASVGKARQWYVYSIPRDLWWVRVRFWFDDLIDRIWGKRLAVYYHSVEGINQLIASAGFHEKEVILEREWRISVFEKKL